jgi:hypothetical protein
MERAEKECTPADSIRTLWLLTTYLSREEPAMPSRFPGMNPNLENPYKFTTQVQIVPDVLPHSYEEFRRSLK